MWDPDTYTRTLRWIILRNLDYMHTIASRRRSRNHSLSLSTGKYRAQDNGEYAHQSNQNPRHCYIFSLFVFVYVYIRREYLKWDWIWRYWGGTIYIQTDGGRPLCQGPTPAMCHLRQSFRQPVWYLIEMTKMPPRLTDNKIWNLKLDAPPHFAFD